MEKKLGIEKASKPLAFIEFGANSHETEYLFTIQADKYSEKEGAPGEWEGKVAELLGDEWRVMDRGARIEIKPPNLKRTPETDARLEEVIKSVIGDYKLSVVG